MHIHFLNLRQSDDDKNFIEESLERKENLFRIFLSFIISGIVLEFLNDYLAFSMNILNSPFSEDVFIGKN